MTKPPAVSIRRTSLVGLMALAAATGACSSSDADKNASTSSGADPMAAPCNIDTGYDGDQYCILPPPPDKGFQLHYGPTNYNDPAEVGKFLIQPGDEITDCMFMKTGNDTVQYFNEYHGRMRPGSHHMLLYVQSATQPDSTAPVDCHQGLDTRNIFGAQTPTIDTKAMDTDAPENQGLAVKLEAQRQGVMQLHFINVGTKPMLREAWANIIYTDPDTVKILGDPIFFIAGLDTATPPGGTQIVKGTATAPSEIRLVMGTGHFHAHTTRFSAWKTIGGVRELLMEDFNWHEPTLMHFDSVTQNQPSNEATQATGGYTGVVQLEAGDTIDWECEIHNTTDQPDDPAGGPVTLTFANEVYKGEMCNMFGMYAPSFGSAWRGGF